MLASQPLTSNISGRKVFETKFCAVEQRARAYHDIIEALS
jgi:hypothetical protein